MQRQVERSADVHRCERVGEGDAPRKIRRLSVAAAGKEAAEASDDVPECDAGCENVAGGPERQTDAADVPECDDDREDEAAVENPA